MSSARRVSALIAAIVVLLLLVAFLGSRENQSDAEIAGPVPTTPEVQPTTVLPAQIVDFSEEELRFGLTNLCSGNDQQSSDKEWTQEDIQTQIDAFNELKLSLSDRLSVSSSAEHLHLAALVEDDPALRVELLDRAMSRNPSDPFLIWGAVQICSESGESLNCPLHDWEQRLIAIDGQNSESWVRVAANRYKAGEEDAALQALRRASTAAESRAYWTEMIEMVERGFAAGSNYAFPERAGIAVGFAASQLPRYGDYLAMCKEQSSRNVDWAYVCLAYGERVENQGKTEMGVAIAQSIQKLALEALGELEMAAVVEQRIEERRQQMLDSIGHHNAMTDKLIFSNPTWYSAYLAAIRSQGEFAARRYVRKEIQRLLEQQPELACEDF